jgi:hypothetical protein
MPPIVGLGIHAVEMLHQPQQIGAAGVDDEVIVVVHEAIGQHRHIEPLHGLPHDGEKILPVFVVLEYRFAPVATGCNMIDRVWKFNAE